MRAISRVVGDHLDPTGEVHRSQLGPPLPRLDEERRPRVVTQARELLGARRRADADRAVEHDEPHRERDRHAVAPQRREDAGVRALQHVPRFVRRQANAHSPLGRIPLFRRAAARRSSATSGSPCAAVHGRRPGAIASVSGPASCGTARSRCRRRCARQCSMSSITLSRDPLRSSRSSSFQSYATASQSMCHQPRAATRLEHERVGVPRQVGEAEQRADGLDPGRAQCRFRARELVVDLLAGQIGEATVRVPVQTDESSPRLPSAASSSAVARPSTQPPWVNRVAGARAATSVSIEAHEVPRRGTDGREPRRRW